MIQFDGLAHCRALSKIFGGSATCYQETRGAVQGRFVTFYIVEIKDSWKVMINEANILIIVIVVNRQ